MGITKETWEKIHTMYEAGKTATEIANELKIPESIIRKIIN